MPPLLYALIFSAAFLAVEGLLLLAQERRNSNQSAARRRLHKLAAGLQAPQLAGEGSILRRSEQNDSFLRRLFGGFPLLKSLELRLYRAGLTLSPERFLLLSVLLALGGWSVGTLLLRNAGLAFALLGLGLLPWLHLGAAQRKRMQQFERQLPEALELITRALRAGNSLTFGLRMVGEELPDPIGTEFTHVAEEIRLGQEVRNALANMAYRIDSPDLAFFTTAVLIQRETGGNLAEILGNLGSIIRERFKLHGKVRAFTAIGRASANILAVWPLVMVGGMYFTNPAYVAPLWETQVGHLMCLAAFGLVLMGYIVCRRMATIRV